MSYAANAYARTSRSAMTPREAEAAVLIKAAQQLVGASRALATGDAGALNTALTFNQRVWTLLSSEATAPESPLPPTDKQGIARLGAFVLRSCLDTMIDPSAEKIEILVSINQNIAAGLQGNPG